jgi:YVTN family beta-propeller protein
MPHSGKPGPLRDGMGAKASATGETPMSRQQPASLSAIARTGLAGAAFGIFVAATAPAHAAAGDAARYVFVPNRASSDVAVIDSARDEVIARVEVGKVPHQVIISLASGKMIASNTGDDTITIVDLETLVAKATLKLDIEPEHMELSPDGLLLAVGNIGAGTVSLVSLQDNTERARVTGLFSPHNLTFSPDGTRLYVANLAADHVSVIDVAKGAVIEEIPVAPAAALAAKGQGSDAEYQGIINVTTTPNGKLGFAAHGEGNTMAVIDLNAGKKIKDIELGELPWRAYTTADGRHMLVPNNGDRSISVISTESLEVVATLPGAEDMTGINSAWLDTTAFVVSRGENKALVIDLTTMQSAGEIALPGTPETAVTTPDGTKVYVALSESNQVAVIDAATRQVIKLIDGVGEEPWGVTMVGAINYCH